MYLRAVASLKLQLDRPEFILRKQEKEKKLKKIKKFFSQAQNCITALVIVFKNQLQDSFPSVAAEPSLLRLTLFISQINTILEIFPKS